MICGLLPDMSQSGREIGVVDGGQGVGDQRAPLHLSTHLNKLCQHLYLLLQGLVQWQCVLGRRRKVIQSVVIHAAKQLVFTGFEKWVVSQ